MSITQLKLVAFTLSLFSFFISNTILAQKSSQLHTVQGKVTESSGEALVGVSVTVANTNNGSATGKNGEYTIGDVSDTATLEFSYIGYTTQRVVVGERRRIDIVLNSGGVGLNQVIVTGYSSQRKKDILGAVSSVDVKSMASIPTGSATDAIQGQASGVSVISNGAPGTSSQIFIRGMTSFGNNNPLVLVDGVEGNLDDVNSGEIESIQVLKDAGSAAIYGVRGSNGVIIVTTKKGKAGATLFTYNSYTGVQLPLSGNPFNLANSTDWWSLSRANSNPIYQSAIPDYMYRAPGGSPQWAMAGDPAVDPSKYIFDPSNYANNYIIGKVNKTGTDWFHEAFKPAIRTNQSIALTGGTDKARFQFSVNYLDENGTLIETYLKRYSTRINSEFNVGKHIRVGENAYLYYYSSPGYNNVTETGIGAILSMPPWEPLYDINGTHYWGTFATPNIGNTEVNPVYIQKSQYNNRSNNWAMVGNIYAEADILNHFTARTSFGGSFTTSTTINFNPVDYTSSTSYAGTNALSEGSSDNLYRIWTNTLKYDNTFGKHKLTVLGGFEAVKYSGKSLNASRNDFFLEDFSYLILQNGQSAINNSSSAYINTLFSLFGQLDYSFNDKYLVGATVRRDGSSQFGANSRYGVFPSGSLGWRLSNEKFMKSISWINDLKVRASYGVLGSQSNVNGSNAYTLFGSGLGSSYYNINGSNTSATPGYYPTQLGNSNTGWEKDIISNIGIDATILHYKLDISADIFKKSISGLLFPQPLPSTAGGAAPPTINIGDVQNTGFEISANYRDKITDDLKFTIGANISHYKNEITSIPGAKYFDVAAVGGRIGNFVRNEIGHPIGSFYGYQIERLFQSPDDIAASPTQQGAAPGMFKYKDINGAGYEDGKPDGVIDANDRTFLGSPQPKYTYGINLGLTYKNFDFLTVFYGSYGNKVFNMVKAYTYFSYFTWGLNRNLLNQWSPTNTKSTIPIYAGGAGGFSEGSVPNSFYIEDGSFLKCRSLILGYTLPARVLERVRIKKLRIYAQAANLFQITKYSGLDPEVPGSATTFGLDLGNYPNNQKQFLFGVNLSF